MVVLLSSCAHRDYPEYQNRLKAKKELNTRAANMIVSTPKMIEGCQYLNEVECSTKRKNGPQRCKKNLKMQAAKLGATHIIWSDMVLSEGNAIVTHINNSTSFVNKRNETYVSGIVYKCE